MANVGKLNVQVTAQTAAFQRNMQKAQRVTNSFAKTTSGAKKAIVALGGALALGKVVAITNRAGTLG